MGVPSRRTEEKPVKCFLGRCVVLGGFRGQNKEMRGRGNITENVIRS